jgi:predicted kinase
MNKKLAITVGIPGCGKSTWARTWFPNEVVVSSDGIREELSDDYDAYLVKGFNEVVFETFHKRIAFLLRANASRVVADSTALDAFARKNLRDIAAQTESQIHAIVFTNTIQAVLRNEARTAQTGAVRRVPDQVMVRMIAKYEQALRDIPTEQYDSVTYIKEFS